MNHLRFILFLLLSASVSAQSVTKKYAPVLPQPQLIDYKNGEFKARNLTIGFAAAPDKFDLFAAEQLSKYLSDVTREKLSVNTTSSERASILFKRNGASRPLATPGESLGKSSRELYQISITNNKIVITSPSSAGLYYAVQTLRQLVQVNGNEVIIPTAEIEDWPSLAYRGFMMDMSHAQFPTVAEIKRQIDFMSRWKANQYLFYSEMSIALKDFPEVMPDAHYTKEQIQNIVEYASLRHVDVIPNLELYGHLHDLLRLEKYADLAGVPHGSEFRGDDPRIKGVVASIVSSVADIFQSPFFHIGFDETTSLEIDARRLKRTPQDLYLERLDEVTKIVEAKGKHAMVWADMLQNYPEIIPKVSKKTIAIPWHYFPMEEKEYDQYVGAFTQAGIPIIVQGASINWNWLVPAYDVSFENTDRLLKAGRKYKATGYIHSGWTDDTQTLMRLTLPDIAYGATASWQQNPVNREVFLNGYARAETSANTSAHLHKAFTALLQSQALLRKIFDGTDEAFWSNPFEAENLAKAREHVADISQSRLLAEDAQANARLGMEISGDSSTFYSILVGAKLLDYLALKYIYAGEIAGFWEGVQKATDKKETMRLLHNEVIWKYHSRVADMLDAVVETKEYFRRAWLHEYTPFRMGVALGKYDYEFQYWLRLQRRLVRVDEDFKKTGTLPDLKDIAVFD